MTDTILSDLINMSRNLGDPTLDYAILAEGNSSAQADADTFWVKASGVSLRTLDPTGLVRVYFNRIAELLEKEQLSDTDIRKGLEFAKVDPGIKALPSVETFLHALLLQLDGVNFIGHTHPTAINIILCSQKAEEAYSGSLFPDQIVVCGSAPVFVPYTDPGLPLARAIRDAVKAHYDTWGETPKMVLMQNHGLIALGKTAIDVENITAMAVKSARVIAGTYALGGPNFLETQQAIRIRTRPDEHYRKSILGTR